MKNLYKGFSSAEFERNKTFILKDVELVNRDLMNHIFTRKGERIMMGNWGTRIPDLPFEPMDEVSLGIFEEDLTMVCNYDPRVQLLNLKITPYYDQNTVIGYAELRYIELNLNDKLYIKLEFAR